MIAKKIANLDYIKDIPNWGEVVATFHGIDDHEWLKESFNFPDRIQLHIEV